MKRVHANTSQYTAEQFPSFYREEGPQFIEFARAFYKWVETESPIAVSRRLFDIRDVDDTDDEYVKHFVYKYMSGLPVERLGDKRFLQKHILDIYRSKGSVEGLRLLFRFLYGEEIDYYIPSKDMLAPSSGAWVEPRYIEVTYSPSNPGFYQKRVTGVSSGATAIVEDYVEVMKRGRPARAMFLSNIEGDFEIGENVVYSGLNLFDAPTIVGSVTGATLTDRERDSTLSDRYYHTQGGLLVRVSAIETIRTGEPEFVIVYGGEGYTLDADVTILSYGLKDEVSGDWLLAENGDYLDADGIGSGASFEVASVSNTVTYDIDTVSISPYEADTLDSTTFTYNSPILTQSLLTLSTEDSFSILTEGTGVTINDLTQVSDWEGMVSFSAGTISGLNVISDGIDYIADVDVIVTDILVSELGLYNANSEPIGNNAVITGEVVFGDDVSTSVKVIDSGFSYVDGEGVTLTYAGEEFVTTEAGAALTAENGDVLYWGYTEDRSIALEVELGALGRSVGYWKNDDGMLNSAKVIQDSFYYQEYSYDVVSSKSLDKYEGFLKKVYHPAGSELFGTARVGDESDFELVVNAAANSVLGSNVLAVVASETNAVAVSFTDKVLVIRDDANTLNSYSGDPFSKMTFTRTTNGSYHDASGALVSANTNVARYEYDPVTLAPLGLLIEEQRINIAKRSNEFTNSSVWAAVTNVTVTANAGLSPDKTWAASLVSSTTGSGDNRLAQSITIPNDANTYTASLYVKKNDSRYCRFDFRLAGGTSKNYAYAVDLDTGNVASVTGGTTAMDARAFQVNDGWWRVTIAGNNNTSGNVTGQLFFYGCVESGGATVNVGSTYVYGAQLEANATFASSYIPTTSANVTRAADVARLDTTSFNMNASEFTMYVHATNRTPNTSIDTVTRLACAMSNGSFNESVYFSRINNANGTFNPSCVTGGAGSFTSVGANCNVYGADIRGAVALKSNDGGVSFNGNTTQVDTALNLPVGIDRVFIGSSWSGSGNFWNGHVKRFMYVGRKMSNTELQTLSGTT